MVRTTEAGIKRGVIEVASMSLRVCLTAAVLLLALSPARAEYVPQRGDVLDLLVSSAPALNRRMTVDNNGDITVPLLGQVKATETALAELGRRIQALLAARNVVQRGEVVVSVAEYGPIYVDGDVARPGEYRYRPGMTVRAAIAVAGGLDASGGLGRSTPAQVSEARGDYGATAIELARQEARTARLKAELSGAESFAASEVTASPGLAGTVLREIVAGEARQMEADRQTRVHEQTHLQRMLAAARGEVQMLERAEEQQRASFEQAVEEAARARELLQKNVGTVARTELAERGLAQARTQIVDIRVRLAQARKEVEERTRQLQTFDDERRAKVLETLRDAVADAGKARFRLQAARERMTGRSDGMHGAEGGPEPEIVVRRVVNGTTVRISAELDMALQSGDSVEVITNGARSRTATSVTQITVEP